MTRKLPSPCKPFSLLIAKATHAITRKETTEMARLMLEWPQIVGGEYAQNSFPEKLYFYAEKGHRRGGILTLCVVDHLVFEYQHLTPTIIERVNQFFGFLAINQVTLKRGYKPTKPPQSASFVATPSQEWLCAVEGIVHNSPADIQPILKKIAVHFKEE